MRFAGEIMPRSIFKDRIALVLVMALASSCASPEDTDRRGAEIASSTQDYGVDRLIARVIGRDCSGLAFNKLGADVLWRGIAGDLSDEGYTRADFAALEGHIDQDALYEGVDAYFARNNLRSRAAVCRAGQREIAAGSRIGKMLEAV